MSDCPVSVHRFHEHLANIFLQINFVPWTPVCCMSHTPQNEQDQAHCDHCVQDNAVRHSCPVERGLLGCHPVFPNMVHVKKLVRKMAPGTGERDRERWAQQAAQTSPTDKGQTILRNWPCVSTGESMWNHFMIFLMTEIKRHDGFSLGEALQQRTPWVTMKRCRYYFTLSLTWSFSKLTLFKLIVISLHLISLIAELLKTNSPLRPS